MNTVTHVFEVFRTPNIVLKDTPIVEKLGLKLVPLVEPIDTIGEQHVDNLASGVK